MNNLLVETCICIDLGILAPNVPNHRAPRRCPIRNVCPLTTCMVPEHKLLTTQKPDKKPHFFKRVDATLRWHDRHCSPPNTMEGKISYHRQLNSHAEGNIGIRSVRVSTVLQTVLHVQNRFSDHWAGKMGRFKMDMQYAETAHTCALSALTAEQ